MINFDDLKRYKQNYKLEAHSLFNLISHRPDIDKTSLYAKDPYEVNISS